MSEEEQTNRMKWRYAINREQRIQSRDFKTISQSKMNQRLHDVNTEKLTKPTDNPELTIRLRESTINQIKEISYQMDKKGNDHTYDDVLTYLVELHTIYNNNQQNDIVNQIVNERNAIAGDIE